MKHIDEHKLETDTAYRFSYLLEFIGLNGDDVAAIHGSAPHLAPLVSALVDAVYVKLFQYDATKRHFVPRQTGYEGATPVSLESLTLDHEMIQFRKAHLGRYLQTLVTKPYDGKMIEYLDMVGKIHTPKAGSLSLVVPLVQMNALMGFVSDALISTIFSLNISDQAKINTVRAFNKLLWVQNDLIARHYQAA